jgi:hypothetical protein
MTMGKWKNGMIGLAAALALAAWSPEARGAACGDLNNNGSVNSGDAVLLLQVASGTNNGATLCGGVGAVACGDMNQDGGISIADVVILLNHAVGNPTLFFCTGQGNQIPVGTTLSGNISTNQVWGVNGQTCCGCDATNTYLVDGTTFVQPGVTITIKPGTCIKEKKGAATPSVLVFKPGAQINAAGQATCPIVFTSDQAPGSRGVGDHGGLVLNGNAPSTVPAGRVRPRASTTCPSAGRTRTTRAGSFASSASSSRASSSRPTTSSTSSRRTASGVGRRSTTCRATSASTIASSGSAGP